MLTALGNEVKTQFYPLGQDKGKYDFNIAIDSNRSTLESLKSYGFETTGKMAQIEAIRLVKAN